MNIKKLVETQEILWQSMRETGYCREYIMGYSHELRWIEANAEKFDVSSYEELCKIRLQSTKPYKISHTTSMYGTFKRFEEDGEFPDRRRHPVCFFIYRNWVIKRLIMFWKKMCYRFLHQKTEQT